MSKRGLVREYDEYKILYDNAQKEIKVKDQEIEQLASQVKRLEKEIGELRPFVESLGRQLDVHKPKPTITDSIRITTGNIATMVPRSGLPQDQQDRILKALS
jgi:archaellum component FlaC